MSGDGGGQRKSETAGETPSGNDAPRVRVRGIYTTAVTRLLLDAGVEVVQASEPIRERFDAEFGDGSHDVTVATTEDRQGVGVDGDPDAVAAVAAELRDVGRDTFAWDDPTPPGAVFEATVTETLGSGAVCDLGESEGFLPYSDADTHLEAGDDVRVQVRESAPPWVDPRARPGTEVRADAGIATLVRGRDGVTVNTRHDAAGRELAGMTALPYVDGFMPVHNLGSLTALAQHLNQLDRHHRLSYRYRPPAVTPEQPEEQAGPTPLPNRRDMNPALQPTFRHPLWGKNPQK
jgi:hypothetical protein